MANTGYKGWTTLLKVTDDGTDRPLDVDNRLCTDTGLPQATKANSDLDPDYVEPVLDLTTCPLPPVEYYTFLFTTPPRDTDAETCADEAFSTTFYAAVPSFVIGTQMYTDTALTIPVGPGNKWRRYLGNDMPYRIDDDGKIAQLGTECAAPPENLFYYRRDGSQIPGNPSFHIPYVDYIDMDGNPQRYYLSMESDDCQSFEAQSIVDVRYAFSCE